MKLIKFILIGCLVLTGMGAATTMAMDTSTQKISFYVA